MVKSYELSQISATNQAYDPPDEANTGSRAEPSKPEDVSRERNSTKVGMEPTLGLVGGISLIVGTMIGSGIFASPGGIYGMSGSVGFALLVWVGTGLIALLGALCYVELGTMILRSGAEWAYLGKAFGGLPAFMFTFVSVTVIRPSSMAIICLTCGSYLVEPFYGLDCTTEEKISATKMLAVSVIGEELLEYSASYVKFK